MYDAISIESLCYYCGMPAEATDHTIPQCMLKSLETLDDQEATDQVVKAMTRLEVPCCGECNSVLNASYQRTLSERKAELKKRLRVRYKKELRIPDWEPRELYTLERDLRGYVLQGLHVRDEIRRRLKW